MEFRFVRLYLLKHLFALVEFTRTFPAIEDPHFGLVKIGVPCFRFVIDRLHADNSIALPSGSVTPLPEPRVADHDIFGPDRQRASHFDTATCATLSHVEIVPA